MLPEKITFFTLLIVVSCSYIIHLEQIMFHIHYTYIYYHMPIVYPYPMLSADTCILCIFFIHGYSFSTVFSLKYLFITQ